MAEAPQRKSSENFMLKLSAFIVDKRNLMFLLFAILIIFSVFSRNWVEVENSLTSYLPEATETRTGLTIMEDEFVTFGTAKIMVANISFPQAEEIREIIEQRSGVFSVDFDDTEEHYTNASALFSVTFDYDETEEVCEAALDGVVEALEGYDVFVSSTVGNNDSETLAAEMEVIIVIVAIVVVSILLLTTETYAEVLVLLITFLTAAIINMGTNFLLGTISFVSNSVTIVLQLALSVDYAVILSHRFKEEREHLPVRDAVTQALSKAIPEISASSMTTIGGLLAMTFMQFRIGLDLGVVLIKAIILSLMSVFLLMPGLLILFNKPMKKTKHRKLIPNIPFVGKFAYKSRFAIPPLFLGLIIAAFAVSGNTPFVYGYGNIETPLQNESQIAAQIIEDNFGSENVLAMLVPIGDYDAEKALLAQLEAQPEIDYAMGLSNTEAMDDYMLTDRLTPREFSELTDLDYEAAELLYAAYAIDDESYGRVVGGVSTYSVPLIDMFMFLNRQIDEGYLTLDGDLQETLSDARSQMQRGRQQLEGENYSRILLSLNLPEEGEETFAFLDELHAIAGMYYEGDTLLVGESASQRDLSTFFQRDNGVVSSVSILIVLAVLLFTFRSVGMPLLLIMVIQGSIWLNFSIPTIADSPVFFMSYLIVTSIQMGANIDYAIVISSRYMELTETMSPREAIIQTMNLSFPTIITSGSMLAIAGALIGRMSSEATISSIGQALGRGTIISIFLVLFVLPQLLLLGDRIVRKTSFSVHTSMPTHSASGYVRVDGRIHGHVSGTVSGTLHGTIRGDVNAIVQSGEISNISHSETECDGEISDE